MAVSKRLRYEVFRRDDFTCRYCGRKPPEVELTIDHVQPTALGGRDVPENLVTCCKPCNSGKTSTVPDAPLVAEVAEDELRWSAAMHVGIAKLLADHQAELEYRDQFRAAWDDWKVGKTRKTVPLDPEWELSVENFRSRGLPIEILTAAIGKAMAAPKVSSENIFRYLCGIAWNKIGEAEAEARKHFEQRPDSMPAVALDDRLNSVIIEAAVATWHLMWCASQGADPTAEQLNDVREYAELAYPEEVSPHDLIRAAEQAAELRTTAITDYLVEDEYPEPTLAERAAHWWFRGWAESQSDTEAQPTAALWTTTAVMIRAAHLCGYDDDTICEAAYRAGKEQSVDVAAGLLTIDEALQNNGEAIRDGLHPFLLTDDQVAQRIARARAAGTGWS